MKTKIFIVLILITISAKAAYRADDTLKIRSLPLVITNSLYQNTGAPAALFLSGDGGWYHFEQSIANHLAEKGIPTIGLDSRKYFWQRRTPEETAADMADALVFYARGWKRNKFVLIGYSLGAEIVPFIVNRLPEKIRLQVEVTVLLSPEITTDFEIHVTNMLGIGNKLNTYDTVAELLKMQNIPTLIIFGEGEKTQVPELLAGTTMKIRKIPGDHHYKSNLPLIMQTITENAGL